MTQPKTESLEQRLFTLECRQELILKLIGELHDAFINFNEALIASEVTQSVPYVGEVGE